MSYLNTNNKLLLIIGLFFCLTSINSLQAEESGLLIKTKGIDSVYYLDLAGNRHAFPNESVYFSWYANFNNVKTISNTELQSYPLKTNVTVRPGTKLIKITTDPSVYTVEPGGVIRKIPSETEAKSIYGSFWSTKVIDISDAFFSNYTIGAPLTSSTPPAGTLVKSVDNKYYYFDGTKYRQITNSEAFKSNRFKSEDIISLATTINPTVIGQNITSTENAISDIYAINTNSLIPKITNQIINNPSITSGGGGGGSSSGGGGSVSSPRADDIIIASSTIVLDEVKPVITAFSAPTSSSLLTIPIHALTATDNNAVVAYLLTESPNTPATSSSAWATTIPTTYTFSATGPKILYAWAKDAAGNISITASVSVSIIVPSFFGDWESGTITGKDSHNWGYKEVMADDRITLINDSGARQGNYYAKIEVRNGDNPIAPTSPGTNRAEVSMMRNDSNQTVYENENSGTVQYNFSTKFDSTWQQPIDNKDGAGKFVIFFQLHPEAALTGAGTTFAFSATDQIRVSLRGGDITIPANQKKYYNLSDGTLNIGNWIDWRFTIKYKKDATGHVLLERRNEGDSNYTEVLNLENIPTLAYSPSVNNGAVGNHYIKYGIYRNNQTFTSILYNDGFTRSTLP